MLNQFTYTAKTFKCGQCQEQKITEQENDGQNYLLCGACGYKEIIPNFRSNTLDKLQFIRSHQQDNSQTFENITK